MSTTTTSHQSFSIPLFAQLVQRLRHTNARYSQIARQCRRTQHPTHHAKRRAHRTGLRIDTSKVSATAIQSLPVLDETPGSLVWAVPETGTEEEDLGWSVEDARTPRLPPKQCSPDVVAHGQPTTCSLSPLELGLGWNSSDDSDACDLRLPLLVPGAPRWQSIPLPEDDCVTEVTASAKPVSCTYSPNVSHGVMATHTSDSVLAPGGVMNTGLGVTVPPRPPKRKLREIEADRRVVFSRQPEVGILNDGYLLRA